MSFNQNAEIAGLSNVSVSVPSAGLYFVKGKVQLPRLAAGGTQSNVVVTVTNNTGPVTLLTSTAGADGFYVTALCAANDVLEVALTSSTAGDEVLNNIKTQVEIGSGN